MTEPSDLNRRISETIAGRALVGDDPIVAGWQDYLKQFLVQMKPFMVKGRMVTFQHLLTEEKAFFEDLVAAVTVPEHVRSLYLPPSVRFQMLVTNHGPQARMSPEQDPDNPPDAGIVLASGSTGFEVILNALFAFAPALPAVDVYDRGQLIGGYTYNRVGDCVRALSDLMRIHL